MVKRWLSWLLFLCWHALLAFNLGIEAMQLLAAGAGVLALVWIVQRLAQAGIDVVAWLGGTDTAPLVVMALMWMMFLRGLGVAQWRARRGPR